MKGKKADVSSVSPSSERFTVSLETYPFSLPGLVFVEFIFIVVVDADFTYEVP